MQAKEEIENLEWLLRLNTVIATKVWARLLITELYF
jgi:hypothetical protein